MAEDTAGEGNFYDRFKRHPGRATNRYRRLDAQCIVDSADRLRRRVSERFERRGLCGVAEEVLQVAIEAQSNHERARRPRIGLRAAVAILIILLLSGEVAAFLWLFSQRAATNWSDYVQGVDASLNSVILSAGAILFLVSSERRLKRRRILRSLQELRALAHVVEMHQLTKDPERLVAGTIPTASSPTMDLTADELSRYLDYCSELLAIASNVAALYVQDEDDQVTLDSADAIAALCTGIAQKIWQKMRVVAEIKQQMAQA